MTEKDITVRIVECEYGQLQPADRELVDAAIEMTSKSYAPYSHFNVGAAIRLDNGTIVTGSNQENAAFPSGTCAERSACFNAGANFPENRFETIAIAAREENSQLTLNPISPCGGCRQALLEYETKGGQPVRVILVGRDKIYIIPSVKTLLPFAFTKF